MSTENTWYGIRNTTVVDTPAFVVYKERLERNIAALLGQVKDPRWVRPHVKTHKMAEVALMMMQKNITQFKCSTIAEAEMLGIVLAPDVLLAYQPVGPKIQRLLRLVEKYPQTKFSCLVDNKSSGQAISEIFAERGYRLPVYIDLNVGMDRTGIKPDEEALDLYRVCKDLSGIIPEGLHIYDGHLRDPDPAERKRKSDESFEPVHLLSKAIEAAGNPKPIVIAGGSPTFLIHAQREEVICSPGTFVFWDWDYKTLLPEHPFIPAALVLSRVISRVDEETLCLDLGHKSVAAENPFPRVHFLNAPDATPVSQSEEHLVVKVDKASQYKVGDLFYGMPVHVCPTCALYEKALVVDKGEIGEEWQVISRNRKISV